MIKSPNFEHVFWAPSGWYYGFDRRTLTEGWYFWDEAGLLGGGPYPTEVEAADALGRYANEVLGETQSENRTP